MHTITLIARWYISGHAPGVMPMKQLYVAVQCFWFSFDIKSKLTVASAAFVTAMILSAIHELD
jgi:hypothetical protein